MKTPKLRFDGVLVIWGDNLHLALIADSSSPGVAASSGRCASRVRAASTVSCRIGVSREMPPMCLVEMFREFLETFLDISDGIVLGSLVEMLL